MDFYVDFVWFGLILTIKMTVKLWVWLKFTSQLNVGWAGVGPIAALALRSLLTSGCTWDFPFLNGLETHNGADRNSNLYASQRRVCKPTGAFTMTPSIFVSGQWARHVAQILHGHVFLWRVRPAELNANGVLLWIKINVKMLMRRNQSAVLGKHCRGVGWLTLPLVLLGIFKL